MFETASMNINWFPGHMASAARKIEQRLKVTDMVRTGLALRLVPSTVSRSASSTLPSPLRAAFTGRSSKCETRVCRCVPDVGGSRS